MDGRQDKVIVTTTGIHLLDRTHIPRVCPYSRVPELILDALKRGRINLLDIRTECRSGLLMTTQACNQTVTKLERNFHENIIGV